MGDIDKGDLSMEAALQDYTRLDYLQRHISVVKESIEYAPTLELPLV
jgi:beta-glucosidase